MFRIKIYIILIAFLPLNCLAQEDQYEKVRMELQQLRSDSIQLVADTLELFNRMTELRDSIALQEQLIANTNVQCEQLAQTFDKTVINRTQNEVEEIQEQFDEMQRTLAQLTTQRQQQSERLDELNDQLSSNSMIIANIQQAQQQQQLEAKRKMMGQYWKLYEEGVKALQSNYNPQNIKRIRDQLKPLIANKNNTPLNAEQFTELDNLDICLSRFKNGVKELQNLMDCINNDATVKQLRQEGNDTNCTACIEAIRKYILPEAGSEGERIQQRYFDRVPYLKDKLRDYWSELQADPYIVPTKTEKEIRKYKIL